MQTQMKIEGQVASCCKCGRQPKHYSERHFTVHFLECAPCETRMPKFGTFTEALQHWETANPVSIAA